MNYEIIWHGSSSHRLYILYRLFPRLLCTANKLLQTPGFPRENCRRTNSCINHKNCSSWLEPYSLLEGKETPGRYSSYVKAFVATGAKDSDKKLLVANEKIGVLLLNLGGPETLDDVQPFLFNLFADPVSISLLLVSSWPPFFPELWIRCCDSLTLIFLVRVGPLCQFFVITCIRC